MSGAISRRAQIIDDDFCATFREFECVGPAKATPCTGDDRDTIFKTDCHASSLGQSTAFELSMPKVTPAVKPYPRRALRFVLRSRALPWMH